MSLSFEKTEKNQEFIGRDREKELLEKIVK
jgi:hypothetical protein